MTQHLACVSQPDKHGIWSPPRYDFPNCEYGILGMTPEGRVKARLKARLKTLPEPIYQFWPVQTGMGAATLDCLLCYKGRFHAIETKAKGKHLTPRQEIVDNAIREAGGVVFRVDSPVSLAYVMRQLDMY